MNLVCVSWLWCLSSRACCTALYSDTRASVSTLQPFAKYQCCHREGLGFKPLASYENRSWFIVFVASFVCIFCDIFFFFFFVYYFGVGVVRLGCACLVI